MQKIGEQKYLNGNGLSQHLGISVLSTLLCAGTQETIDVDTHILRLSIGHLRVIHPALPGAVLGRPVVVAEAAVGDARAHHVPVRVVLREAAPARARRLVLGLTSVNIRSEYSCT